MIQTKLEPIDHLQKEALIIVNCVYQRNSSELVFRKLSVLSVLSVFQVNYLRITLFVQVSLKRSLPPSFHEMFVFIYQTHSYPS